MTRSEHAKLFSTFVVFTGAVTIFGGLWWAISAAYENQEFLIHALRSMPFGRLLLFLGAGGFVLTVFVGKLTEPKT